MQPDEGHGSAAEERVIFKHRRGSDAAKLPRRKEGMLSAFLVLRSAALQDGPAPSCWLATFALLSSPGVIPGVLALLAC